MNFPPPVSFSFEKPAETRNVRTAMTSVTCSGRAIMTSRVSAQIASTLRHGVPRSTSVLSVQRERERLKLQSDCRNIVVVLSRSAAEFVTRIHRISRLLNKVDECSQLTGLGNSFESKRTSVDESKTIVEDWQQLDRSEYPDLSRWCTDSNRIWNFEIVKERSRWQKFWQYLVGNIFFKNSC